MNKTKATQSNWGRDIAFLFFFKKKKSLVSCCLLNNVYKETCSMRSPIYGNNEKNEFFCTILKWRLVGVDYTHHEVLFLTDQTIIFIVV